MMLFVIAHFRLRQCPLCSRPGCMKPSAILTSNKQRCDGGRRPANSTSHANKNEKGIGQGKGKKIHPNRNRSNITQRKKKDKKKSTRSILGCLGVEQRCRELSQRRLMLGLGASDQYGKVHGRIQTMGESLPPYCCRTGRSMPRSMTDQSCRAVHRNFAHTSQNIHSRNQFKSHSQLHLRKAGASKGGAKPEGAAPLQVSE